MPGRGPQTFKKRQKEQERRERQQEKLVKRQQRKVLRETEPRGNDIEPFNPLLIHDEDDNDVEYGPLGPQIPSVTSDDR